MYHCRYEQKQIFIGVVVSFLAFYAAFAWVLYPARAFLHPEAMCDAFAAGLPASFSAPIAVVRHSRENRFLIFEIIFLKV